MDLRNTSQGLWKNMFFALIAEMDLVVKNLINLFFITRFLGSEGAAAYEVVMPCVMIASAFVAMGYNGVQAVCAKDYGAKDPDSFERHKNAGYTWLLLVMVALSLLFAAFSDSVLDLLGAGEGSQTLYTLSRDCYHMFLLCFVPQSIFSIACCLLYLEERKRLLVVELLLYGCMLSGNLLVTVVAPSMIGYMAVNVVSVTIADLYLIVYCFILKRKDSLAAFTAFRVNPADIREAFFTGLPDFMEYGFVAIFYLVENNYLLSRFSESMVAGVGVFEAIDNLPETICVGFSFLVTASLGTRVGRITVTSAGPDRSAAVKELDETAGQLTKGAVIGSLLFGILLVLLARPIVEAFLMDGDLEAKRTALWLTISCASGFVFYMLNSELVCYYKIVEAYAPAHIMFLAEALLFPLGFKLLMGELFGVIGFCMGGFVGEVFTFLLNLTLVWKFSGCFPRRVSDFRMDNYLNRLNR